MLQHYISNNKNTFNTDKNNNNNNNNKEVDNNTTNIINTSACKDKINNNINQQSLIHNSSIQERTDNTNGNNQDDNHQRVESTVTMINNPPQEKVVLAAGTQQQPRISKRLQAKQEAKTQPVVTKAPLQQTAVRISARLQARATTTVNDNQEKVTTTPLPTPEESVPSTPPTKESLKLLEIINAIPSAKLPESTRNLLTGSGEWSNRDLDEAFAQLNLNRMPARFLVDMQDHPSPTLNTLKTKMKDTL